MRKASVVGIICLTVFVFCAPSLWAYSSYDGGGDHCIQCHPNFSGGPGSALHDLHVSPITGTCLLCHTNVGDDPKTSTSGDPSGQGCRGCHRGPGLRLHHANAGVPPDAGGLTCAQCHPGDPAPLPENTLPVYYSRADVNVKAPCQAQPAPPGEDFNGDGNGLDNDGDNVYDGADPDCQQPPPGSCAGSAEASTRVPNPVYGPTELGKLLGWLLFPVGAVIGMMFWRRKR